MTSVRWLWLIAGLTIALAGGVAAETSVPGPVKPAAKAPADEAVASPWPRKFTEDGVEITLHQPQLEEWQGNTLSGRLAVAVKTGTKPDAEGKAQDVLSYGAAWFTARADVDKVARKVTLTNVRFEKVSFPTDRANETKYQTLLGKIAAHGAARVVSLDQLESALAINRELKASQSVQNVRNDPPDVLFSFQPALLVLIDGEPRLKPAGTSGVERVVNTRSLLVKTGGRFYLSFAGRWVTSLALAGPWAASLQVPPSLEQVRAAAEKSKVVDLMDKPADALKDLLASGKLPQIFVSTKSAELITFDGDPAFVDIPDTSLAYASNTPSDVFIDKSHDNFWYVLISGRWFAAPGSNGPWTYTAGNVLPNDFSKIPPDDEKSAVLASIPGTPEARESLIANSIPQTATVKKGQASLTVQYDGAPQFKPIEGTSLTYAWNTSTPVIKVAETAYYAVQNGVWFVGTSANGPWVAATEVPSVIYSIPASSPLHYVTYVRIYSASDDEIYVGYTPGYYGTVVSNDVVVYGTGYTCDPWVGDYWYGCPATYGFNVDFGYDPWVGWTFGYGWGWGYPYAWYGPWWGPWGWYPYYPGYGWGYWGGGIATANIYGRWGNTVVAGVGAAWANPWTGNYGSAVRGRYENERTGGRGAGYAGRNYNAYTGTTTAAAGGIRYNPQTGRVVAGNVAGASNPYTGNAVAGGSRTTVNTNTGRVTESAGVAGKTNQGAGAAGAINSEGARGDVSGAGYVRYDKATGEVSKGGVINYNDQIYAGKDGNVYKYDKGEGWSEVGGGQPKVNRASDLPSAGNLDSDRYARDRGGERDLNRNPGAHAGGGRDFDRGSYGGNYRGQMGGYRSARGGGGFGGGGGRRR